MDIKITCRACDRGYPLSMATDTEARPGHCPFCGEVLAFQYSGTFVDTADRVMASAASSSTSSRCSRSSPADSRSTRSRSPGRSRTRRTSRTASSPSPTSRAGRRSRTPPSASADRPRGQGSVRPAGALRGPVEPEREVLIVADGENIVTIAQARAPDVIVIGASLGQMGGFAVCEDSSIHAERARCGSRRSSCCSSARPTRGSRSWSAGRRMAREAGGHRRTRSV